jgi:hypothetical protein
MAEYREPPKDTKTAINALWHTVIGTNGEGLVTKFETLDGKVDGIVENMVTKTDMKELKNKRRSRWLAIKDAVLLLVAILGALKTVGVL